jgi:hypothetical protein
MAAVGDVERRRIWMVTKSADKALAAFRMTTSFKPISAKAWNAFMSFLRSVRDNAQGSGAAHRHQRRQAAGFVATEVMRRRCKRVEQPLQPSNGLLRLTASVSLAPRTRV